VINSGSTDLNVMSR